MKIVGIIILAFAILNFIVAIIIASSGNTETVGHQMSSALLLGIIGSVLFYFGNRKKRN